MKRLQDMNTCSLTNCLLLLCILTSGKADCPKPQGKSDIVLTNETLLKNAFPEGSEATFECANGYVRDDGSGTVTCTDGKWSEPDLSCKKKDCGPLRALPHVSYNVSQGTLFGAKAKVSCDDGYYLIGSSFRQCYSTGWSGRTKCEVVTCDMPSEIVNGTNKWHPSTELPKYGDIINYTCDEGYTLTGNSSIECNKKGEYSFPPPECKAISCPTPDIPFSITTRSEPPFVFKSKASYICEEGYTLQGSPDLVCEINGWSPAFPSCIKAEISNGVSTVEGITTLRHISSTTPSLTTTRAISATTSLRGGVEQDEVNKNEVETNKTTGYVAVAASVICTLIVVLILLYIIHRWLLKRKGRASNGTTPIG